MSGLVDAILLAETGRKVVVLEHHTIPGGYLQQFKRKKTVFDVGFHYMGSTNPGRPMRQMLEHLQIFHRIRLLPFPDEAAIEVRSGDRRFAYPARWDRFQERAQETWPHEREALDRLAKDVDEICSMFRWFDLKQGSTYRHPLDLELPRDSLTDYMESFIEDPWLKEVLSFQSFNLGLFAHEIPWPKHALAFRSNFDTTCRVEGGGGALAAALVERGKEMGIEYRFRCGAAGFQCADKRVQSVTTEKGDCIEADLFVAACHPKVALRMVPDDAIKPMYKRRIFDMKDSRGAVQIFVRLNGPLESLGATCVMLHDAEEAAKDLPLDTLLITYPTAVEQGGQSDRGGPRLEAMTYMDQAPFEKWRNEPVKRRSADYGRLKRGLADRMLKMITRIAPELPDRIEDVYAATPLSDEWYTRNVHGSVFGVSHDVTQQGMDRPLPRMRLRNLFFSGHSLTMPGICGTFINAFDTCDMIRNDGVLFDSLAT